MILFIKQMPPRKKKMEPEAKRQKVSEEEAIPAPKEAVVERLWQGPFGFPEFLHGYESVQEFLMEHPTENPMSGIEWTMEDYGFLTNYMDLMDASRAASQKATEEHTAQPEQPMDMEMPMEMPMEQPIDIRIARLKYFDNKDRMLQIQNQADQAAFQCLQNRSQQDELEKQELDRLRSEKRKLLLQGRS